MTDPAHTSRTETSPTAAQTSASTSAQVNQDLHAQYDAQYADPRMATWRAVGAADKVARLLRLVDAARLRPSTVLEVGAGEGSVLAGLAQGFDRRGLTPELHALEISASGVDAIRRRTIPRVASVQAFDGYRLPFADASVDLVVLCHVLEHVEHERILLRELHRVARHVLIEVPRELQPGADARWRHFLSYGHINLYTPTSLRFLLATEGFAVEHEALSVTGDAVLRANPSVPYSGRVAVEYALRRTLMRLPVRAVHERVCNAVTLLCRPVARPALMG